MFIAQNLVSVQWLQQNLQEKNLVLLEASLPALDLDNPVLQQLIYDLSPATEFGNRMILSNAWLLRNMQQKKVENNSILSTLFGSRIETTIRTDSSQNTFANIDIYTTRPFQNIKTWLANNLQHPQVNLLGEPTLIQTNNYIAPIDNHVYRLISNTCKEIFDQSLVAPCIVPKTSLADSYAAIGSPVYYFSPVIYNQEKWVEKQSDIDEKISLDNLQKAAQYYYQLLSNAID